MLGNRFFWLLLAKVGSYIPPLIVGDNRSLNIQDQETTRSQLLLAVKRWELVAPSSRKKRPICRCPWSLGLQVWWSGLQRPLLFWNGLCHSPWSRAGARGVTSPVHCPAHNFMAKESWKNIETKIKAHQRAIVELRKRQRAIEFLRLKKEIEEKRLEMLADLKQQFPDFV